MNGAQRQIKLTGFVPQCLCGATPKGYITTRDNKPDTFHLECFPCRISTVRLLTIDAARMEFRRVVQVVLADRDSHHKKLSAVPR